MNHHKRFLDEKWGRIISPRSEREPASEPAGSRAPGWTTCQCLRTASNRTCWKSSSILVWKSTFFSSLKPKLVPTSAQCSVYNGARGWGIVPLSTPRWFCPQTSPPLLLANCFWNLSVTFNPHLHVPTEQSFAQLPNIHWTTFPMALQPPNGWRGERKWSVWKAAGAQ